VRVLRVFCPALICLMFYFIYSFMKIFYSYEKIEYR
jgi:hypothetical protein